jgi:hypothetical protein
VSIDTAAVTRFAQALSIDMLNSLVPPPPSAAEHAAPAEERVALVMAQMAVNFCYFPAQGDERWWVLSPETGEPVGCDDEAHAMTAALLAAWTAQCATGGGFASGVFLSGLSDGAAAELFAPAPGAGVLPMLVERAAALRELGSALVTAGGLAKFMGQVQRRPRLIIATANAPVVGAHAACGC